MTSNRLSVLANTYCRKDLTIAGSDKRRAARLELQAIDEQVTKGRVVSTRVTRWTNIIALTARQCCQQYQWGRSCS